MYDETTLPIHPLTGLRAIGIGKRGPIWPVAGASEDDASNGLENPADALAGGGDETPSGAEDLTPPSADNWWQFASKEDAIAWGNKTVQERLKRERQNKLDPITAERDTLKAEVDRLKPFEEAALTDAEKRERQEKATNDELAELRSFKAQTERQNLINVLTAEVGLDPKYLKFVDVSGDEATIRANMTDLLNVLSEDGNNTSKKAPTPKAPKESEKETSGSFKPGGGSGDADDSDDALAASIMDQIRENRKRGGLMVGKR